MTIKDQLTELYPTMDIASINYAVGKLEEFAIIPTGKDRRITNSTMFEDIPFCMNVDHYGTVDIENYEDGNKFTLEYYRDCVLLECIVAPKYESADIPNSKSDTTIKVLDRPLKKLLRATRLINRVRYTLEVEFEDYGVKEVGKRLEIMSRFTDDEFKLFGGV